MCLCVSPIVQNPIRYVYDCAAVSIIHQYQQKVGVVYNCDLCCVCAFVCRGMCVCARALSCVSIPENTMTNEIKFKQKQTQMKWNTEAEAERRQNKNDGWDGRIFAACTHTHTHCFYWCCCCQRSLTHTHTWSARVRRRRRRCGHPTMAQQNTLTLAQTHTYIRYIYFFISFVGLAFFDCDDFISFVFQFHFVSDNSAHSLAPSRLCWLFSPLSDSLAHTHTSHTDRAGGLQPINMSERQRRIYIFALYVRRYGCVWLSVCCPVARAHSLQWLTWLI